MSLSLLLSNFLLYVYDIYLFNVYTTLLLEQYYIINYSIAEFKNNGEAIG